MPEENGGGKEKTSVLEKVQADAAALRETLKEKTKQQVDGLKEPEKTQLYRSMFRVKHDDEPRNRALSVLSFTGVLLMFYYHPTKVQAFRDILYLENDVPFGKLLRNMHRWAAHLMIIAVWLHMFRVFLTGSYKRPREFNWCVGVLLMVLTMLLSFTGYLLPDDQLGFWAVTVGTNMARATPFLGHEGPLGGLLGMTPYNDV